MVTAIFFIPFMKPFCKALRYHDERKYTRPERNGRNANGQAPDRGRVGLRRRRGRNSGRAGSFRGRVPRLPGRRKPDHRRRHGPAGQDFSTGDCATCIISPKLVECMRDYNIDVLTMTDVKSLDGEAGSFKVEVQRRPRGVNAEKCTGCGDCWQACPVRNVPEPAPA